MKALRAAFLIARVASLAAVLQALTRGGRSSPPIEVASSATETARSISVVVPARNESTRIGPLLDALAEIRTSGSFSEVIVVDDGSTDDTASVARTAGAHVVSAGDPPAGWLGKPWAIQRGVEAASGEWIVTLDADARPNLSLPRAAVDRCIVDRIDLLTLAPAIECPTPGMAWLHTSMLTTLVYRFGRPGTPAPLHRQLANGQCMVFRRDWFVDGGGFGAACAASEEDVAFARLAARRGDRVAFLEATALLSVRAYESFVGTWVGWGRSIGLSSVTSPAQRFIDVAVLGCMMPLPWLRLLVRRSDVIDAVAIACRLGTLAGTRSTYVRSTTTRAARAGYWLSPLADPLAWFVVALGSIPMRRTWRGRET